jgi:hypothetical protein
MKGYVVRRNNITMKFIQEKIKEYGLEIALSLLWSLLLGLGGTIFFIGEKLLPVDTINTVEALTWAKLSALLSSVCLALIISIAYLYYKTRPKYEFIPDIGVERDLKSGQYFCASCRIKNPRSPLKKTEYGWICQMHDCRHQYYKPGHEPKKKTREVISPGINES